MLQKNDLILLLSDIEQDYNGKYNCEEAIQKVLTSSTIPFDVLKMINDVRPLEVTQFYERIRKNHNQKKSDLYKNIVTETNDTSKILTTLSAFILQVNLFANHLENNHQMFYKHTRAEEVTRVLNNYYKTYDLTTCITLLRLIKSDILAFETINGRRKNED